jgi:hypothetical protein
MVAMTRLLPVGCQNHRMGQGNSPAHLVLTEDEAVELLAYLVTAARTQLDEAAEYGPLRLLTAARRLGEMIAPRSSQPLRELVTGPLQELGPVPLSEDDDRGEFAAQLDATCVAVADHAMQRVGLRKDQ